jgi:hypothetical protein
MEKGRIMAWFRNGDPMNDAVGALLDEDVSVTLKRSDFLRDELCWMSRARTSRRRCSR